jgi:hypothetical protein
MDACRLAALGWLVDFSGSAYRDYHPGEGKNPETEANCLTTSQDANKLYEMAMDCIRTASISGELLNHKQLPRLLFSWGDCTQAEVRQWTSARLGDDLAVVKFAKAFTSYSWVHSVTDTVSRRLVRAGVDSLDKIMDRDRFRARVEELAVSHTLSEQDAETIRIFLAAWKRRDENPRD